MLQIINLSFAYSDQYSLFHQLHVNLGRTRYGLVGPNAAGKSTLLALIAGQLTPTAGSIFYETRRLQYMPQQGVCDFAESTDLSVIEVGRRIQTGEASAEDWTLMEESWPLYASMEQKLQEWGLQDLNSDAARTWSGGTWQRLRLALTLAHGESFLLLDEPSNHLDRDGRLALIEALRHHRGGCVVASHDRELLNAMDVTLALEAGSIQVYGGPYDFYKVAYDEQQAAFHATVEQTQQKLERARGTAQRVREKQTKKSAQGYRDRSKLGIPRVAWGMRRMQAEQTTARLEARHEEKITQLQQQLRNQAEKLRPKVELHFDMKAQRRPGSGPLLTLDKVQHRWSEADLWCEPLYLQVAAGEHLAIAGANGSGKTTLLQMIMGHLEPTSGQIHRRFREVFLLDQNLGSLPHKQSLLEIWKDPLYELDEGLRRTIAARLGLKAREAEMPLEQLSGGQRLRAALVLLATRITAPDLILLDEPTNHLDLAAQECLLATLRALPATFIIVTHDARFLEDLAVHRRFELVAGAKSE